MHFLGSWGFMGMHVFWWVFWAVLIVVLLAFFVPVPRSRGRGTPLEHLQRRYADGEISTEEYEQRKKRLEKDTPKPQRQRD